jgi:hypothetical protein
MVGGAKLGLNPLDLMVAMKSSCKATILAIAVSFEEAFTAGDAAGALVCAAETVANKNTRHKKRSRLAISRKC